MIHRVEDHRGQDWLTSAKQVHQVERLQQGSVAANKRGMIAIVLRDVVAIGTVVNERASSQIDCRISTPRSAWSGRCRDQHVPASWRPAFRSFMATRNGLRRAGACSSCRRPASRPACPSAAPCAECELRLRRCCRQEVVHGRRGAQCGGGEAVVAVIMNRAQPHMAQSGNAFRSGA